ncbi:putative phosphoglycerate mutase [Nocardioides cavernae]|uniref:Putative phosphoglycerate mutase n=1 Tax=Nocardioides cavernae TaxID=1921566 RepID=A0A7Y9KSP2_9ACTN|nr:histidine phosphatase family protein [Nocardioides cavernae]NYE37784.1 putative phosphoglycerate mutase [Nocardioides cavernae]
MSLPRTLVVMRHGRTSWNDAGRAQGHADIELDEVGHAQAAAAATALARLGPTRIWCSDLARARQTAEVLGAATGVRPEVVPALREYDVGTRTGMTFDEFEAAFPEEYLAWLAGDESLTVPGAETTSDVRARLVPAMRACLDALAPGETGVVVAHGAALRVGVAGLLGWTDEMDETLAGMDNCHWLRLREHVRFGHLQLASYNESAT